MKRIVCISDLHCGHFAGLTHPNWYVNSERMPTIAKLQRETWNEYHALQRKYYKPDFLFVLGDCIDGRGEKSGGSELICTDRIEQVQMAEKAITGWDAQKIFMVRGTPYHTGETEDFENQLAKDVNATIDDQLFIEINNKTFYLRHSVGSSAIPYSRHTQPAKMAVNNILMSNVNQCPTADVFIFGHVHYFTVSGNSQQTAFTLPALQLPSSKFGNKKCSGIIDWGILIIYINDNGSFSWTTEIKHWKTQSTQLIKT
jgi:predicted phosphodiesterase